MIRWQFNGSGDRESLREELGKAVIADIDKFPAEQQEAYYDEAQRVLDAVALITDVSDERVIVSASGWYRNDGAMHVNISVSALTDEVQRPDSSLSALPDGRVVQTGPKREKREKQPKAEKGADADAPSDTPTDPNDKG